MSLQKGKISFTLFEELFWGASSRVLEAVAPSYGRRSGRGAGRASPLRTRSLRSGLLRGAALRGLLACSGACVLTSLSPLVAPSLRVLASLDLRGLGVRDARSSPHFYFQVRNST